MAFATVAVLVVTTVVFANANSNNVSDRWLDKTKITTLSAVPESATALHAQWQPMTWALSYDLTYSGTNVPNRVLLRGITMPTRRVDSLSRGGTYSVRVRPVRNGQVGPWSQSTQVTLPLSEDTTPTSTTPTATTEAPTTTTTTTATTTTTGTTTTTATPTTSTATATTTTAAPTTSAAPTTTVSGTPGAGLPCGIAGAAFCETFDAPAGGGTRTGDLDPVLWGVSRVGNINPVQMLNDIPRVSMSGCGTTDWTYTPNDVRICNGKMFETVNDGGGVVHLNTYPKQPFDFAGRTGKVTFDVSADSDGSHGAWPEFVITDKPVPGVRRSISFGTPAAAANEIGFSLDGCSSGPGGNTGVGTIFVTKNNVYSEPAFNGVGCVTKGSFAAMNHFEVRISQNRMEVWGTDAGSSALKQLAVADNLALTFTKGLVWLDDVHYNARKSIEPCECGTQYNHTFAWDNLGFDGPKTYRDLGFDVPDANVAGGVTFAGDSTRRVGYSVGPTPVTLSVTGVYHDQTPTGALVVYNAWSFDPVNPSISINGGPWIDAPWVSDDTGWHSLAVPVPLDQIHDGTNTIAFKSSGSGTVVANISLIIVAGAPVP